jgi:hypothetical protein
LDVPLESALKRFACCVLRQAIEGARQCLTQNVTRKTSRNRNP